jgi:hypothetical protein
MSPRRNIRNIVLLSVASVALGCTNSGGQTGEETNEPCVESRSALELDAETPLGGSAGGVLARLGSSIHAPLEWLSVEGVEYGPEKGTSSLSLQFEREAAAFWVDSEPRSADVVELGQLCQDRVEIERFARLSTSEGALDEQFLATLSATQEHDVWLIQIFDPEKLNGRLTLTPALGKWTRLTLQFHFRNGEVSGQFAAGIERTSGSDPDGSSSFENASLACFGTGADGSSSGCVR